MLSYCTCQIATNIINRNSFKLLSGTDVSKPYIVNPVNRDDTIYVLFDTVHLLKCVRNNRIHLRNNNNLFVYIVIVDSLYNAGICVILFDHGTILHNTVLQLMLKDYVNIMCIVM